MNQVEQSDDKPPYGVRQIANWILDHADKKGHKITNMALNKLIYFAYEKYLVETGSKLTKAKIEAWEHGPVFREIYRSFKSFDSKPISKRATLFDASSSTVKTVEYQFSAKTEKFLEEALDDLIALPAHILRELSHASGGPWDSVWWHRSETNPGMEITDKIILSSNAHIRISQ